MEVYERTSRCIKCQSLCNPTFWHTFCPSDGQRHAVATPTARVYQLFWGIPETAHAQANWRLCAKCAAVYYDGYADKGPCDAGDTHTADPRFNFALPHGVPAGPHAEDGWEYCVKCKVLFYDRLESKGNCAGTGPHKSDPNAFHFVLTHGAVSLEGDVEQNPVDG
jgi:hypothetical protein